MFDRNQIDSDILPIVDNLREAGFKTSGSCQGGLGHSFKLGTESWSNSDCVVASSLTAY